MANLENNSDKEKDNSVSGKIEGSVKKGVQDLQEATKQASELASDAINHPIETAGAFAEQAAKDVVSVKWWARLLQILFWSVLGLIILFVIAVNLPITKNWAAQKVISKLNEDLKAQISFKKVDVNYFGDIYIYGVSVKDYKNYPFLKADELYADSNWFSIISDSRNLQFQSMSLDKMDLKVITYKNDSISNFIRFVQLFDSGKPSVNKEPFQLKSRIYINNSKISIVNQNHEGDQGKWLDATDVSLIVPEIIVKGSDVNAQINNLRFKTKRWGKEHYVETFSTNMTLNKQFLYLKDLTLNTSHSLLEGNIKFNLHDNGSWSDFTDKVGWEMDLKRGSQLSGYDISYFVTNWDNYKPFNISGEMAGPLNSFSLQNFVISNPQVNIRTEKLNAQNLLKGNFIIQTPQLTTDFTYVDLKAMMPTFISEKMKNFADDFGRLRYQGSARVTPEQVYVASGNLLTGIGQAKISQFYLSDYSTNLPKYKGFADVTDLNTSVITQNKQVGLISGRFDLDGQSFDVNTIRLNTKSFISKIMILDKEINNIELNGLLDHKQYSGIINVNDEQAKINAKGFIDFRTSRILADLDANVNYLNLSYFSGSKTTQTLSGHVNGKIAMSDLNDMNLDANLQGIVLNTGLKKYNIPNGSIKAFFDQGNRIVTVDAPGAITGQISGKFNLGDLAGMVSNGLDKILVGPPPRKLYRGQNFEINFNIQLGLASYFLPQLALPNGAHIDGSYDGNGNNLKLNINASSLKYIIIQQQTLSDSEKSLVDNMDDVINSKYFQTKDSASVDSISIKIDTENLQEQISAGIKYAKYGNNIFRDVLLRGTNENNQKLRITADFKHGFADNSADEALKDYAININQTTDSNGDYVFRFEPTELKFNDVAWSVDPSPELNHSITYRRSAGDFLIKNLRIFSEQSELMVKDALFKSASDFDAFVEVKNLEIGKILAMQKQGNANDFKGIANGTLDIKMNDKTLQPLVDFNIQNITMGSQKLGDLVINIKNSSTPNVFEVDAKVESSGIIGNNNLHLTGNINNNTASPTVDLNAEMNDFDLAFSQQFVDKVFGNMRGKATGTLKIAGPLNDINYSGDIGLKNFGLKLIFTGVDYSFDDTVVSLSRGLAVLNDIGVRDGRNNSKGSISGAIQFETLASMGVNLVMRADNLLLLNTTQKDYDLFWGRVYGQGDLFVDGPVSGLNISTPNMKTLNTSVFTFNSNSTSNVEEFKMLRFLKRDKDGTVTLEEKEKTGANMNLDFNVTVDKGTTVNVLVGDDIGDITVRGAADKLRFNMSRTGNISMNGNYVVDNGTFISKAILERTFQIDKYSRIQWDGDAMSPELNINATYLRTVTNAGAYLNMGSLQPINVQLNTKITGKLNNPDINLGVNALDVSSQVKEALAEKMSNEDEKVIQFGSVLVLNSFNVTSSSVDILGNSLESNGYNMLFKQLGSVLNNISNEFQVDLNYLKGDAASNSGDRANASVSFALSPRITVKTGLGIPVTKTENANNNYLSGEGIIEYDWSRKNDGTRILRAYSKPTNIGLGTGNMAGNASANQSYGVGVVYSKSFNSVFKRRRKIKNKLPPAPTPIINSPKKDSVK